MKNRVFIFSTREIKKDKGLFKKSRVRGNEHSCIIPSFVKFKLELSDTPEIIQAFEKWIEDADLNEYKTNIENIIKDVERGDKDFDDAAVRFVCDSIINKKDELITKYLINTKKYLDILPFKEVNETDFIKYNCQYYEILNSETDRVVAVNLLEKRLAKDNNKRWIETLKEIFSENTNNDTNFYFLLHDEDLEGYNGVDFRVLSKEDKDDNDKVFNKLTEASDNIHILVFQHTINPAVNLLNKNEDVVNEKIAHEIEAVFYRQPFKEKIINFADEKFKGNDTKSASDGIKKFLTAYESKIALNEDKELSDLYKNWYLESGIQQCKKLIHNLNVLPLHAPGNDYLYCYEGNSFNIIVEELSSFQNPLSMEREDKAIFYQNILKYDEGDKQVPIIHVSLSDFLDDSKMEYLAPYLPRYKNIIDSSIWNYYVPYDPNEKKDFTDGFKLALDDICRNYANRLYALPKSKEYADLMYRLVKESFLNGKGHRSAISPFLFHSENKMRKATDEIIKKEEDGTFVSRELFEKRSWRFLLVDDESFIHEDEPKDGRLTEEEKERTTVAIRKSKCEIIKNLLKDDFNFVCVASEYCKAKCQCTLQKKDDNENQSRDKTKIEIVCAQSNKSAYNRLASSQKFDVVLMDYLLGENDERTAREYSNKLLQDIKDVFDESVNKEIKKSAEDKWLTQFLFGGKRNFNDINKKILKDTKGINGRFWFFFISAYNIAVHERLLNEQFLHNTNYWHIEEGACPINTPQLFKYLLFSLLKRQIEVITGIERGQEDIITLIPLLGLIYTKNDERENAIKNFNNLLKLRSNYDKIKYDVLYKPSKDGLIKREDPIEKSPLIESLFSDIKHYDNAFWEHLQHLVYLTAYGTIRQWPDMWEEFRFVKYNLMAAEKDISKDKKVYLLIERYIISLKDKSES